MEYSNKLKEAEEFLCYFSNEAAIVYDWNTAPQVFKDLSTNGGDEDFIAICLSNQEPPWLDSLLARYHDPEIIYIGKRTIYIGVHS